MMAYYCPWKIVLRVIASTPSAFGWLLEKQTDRAALVLVLAIEASNCRLLGSGRSDVPVEAILTFLRGQKVDDDSIMVPESARLASTA
jgi:hypothetical protein